MSAVSCQNCNTAPATLRCTNCAASLCETCKEATHSAPLFKAHVMMLLTAGSVDASAAPEKEKKEKKAKKDKKEDSAKENKSKKDKKGIYGMVVDGLHYVGSIGASPHADGASTSDTSASTKAEEKKEKKEEVKSPRKSVKGLFGLLGKKEDGPAESGGSASSVASEPAKSPSTESAPQAAASPRSQQANANAAEEARLRDLALKEADDRARREEADRVIREAEERAAADRQRNDELAAQAREREKLRDAEIAREQEAKAKERAAYDQVLVKAESESRQFLESVLHEQLPAGDLAETLRSGVVLCRALNALRPGAVARIDTSGQAFKQRENLGYYLEACRAAGIKDEFLFVTADLFDSRNVPQVLRHVIALKRHFADSMPPASASSPPASPHTAASYVPPVSPRTRMLKPLPPTPPPQAAAVAEDRPPSWLNNTAPPAPPPVPEQQHASEQTSLAFAQPAEPVYSAPAPPAPVTAPAAVPAPTSVVASGSGSAVEAKKSVTVQEPASAGRHTRPYGDKDNADDELARETERLERTVARKSGKGISFAPTVKALEPAAAPAPSSPSVTAKDSSSPAAEATPAQAGDFNYWNAKSFADLRKECEKRNVKAQTGGKEGFIKALMAHYGHAPAAPVPTPAPVIVAAPAPVVEKPSPSASLSASSRGQGTGTVTNEHNVNVPHSDVDEELREQQRLDRAVARKSGKFRAGI